jgi:hypothetical protein
LILTTCSNGTRTQIKRRGEEEEEGEEEGEISEMNRRDEEACHVILTYINK